MNSLIEQFIREVLIESRRIEFVQEKYGIADDKMEWLSKLDPTKNKRYIEWIAKLYTSGAESFNDSIVSDLLDAYDHLKNTNIIKAEDKQIIQFTGVSDLNDVLKNYGLGHGNWQDLEFYSGYGLSRWGTWKALAAADPSEGKQHLNWIVSTYLDDGLLIEDLYKVTEYLSHVKESDSLANFDGLGELAKFLKDEGRIRSDYDFNIEKLLPEIEGEYKLFYEDGQFTVYLPETFEASCALGKGTEWCTAKSKRFYDDYSSKGHLYIIIDKSTGRRTQAHWDGNDQDPMIMDENDSATYLPYQLVEKIPEAVYANALSDPELPEDVLIEWAEKMEKWSLESVARNTKSEAVLWSVTNRVIREKLGGQTDIEIEIARNKAAPASVLLALLNGENTSDSPGVARSAVRNPNADEEVLRTVYYAWDNSHIVAELLENDASPADVIDSIVDEQIAKEFPELGVLSRVIGHPGASSETIDRMHDALVANESLPSNFWTQVLNSAKRFGRLRTQNNAATASTI